MELENNDLPLHKHEHHEPTHRELFEKLEDIHDMLREIDKRV